MNDETLKRRKPPMGLGTGDPATAIELLALEIRDGCKQIAEAIGKLAEAIEDHGA